MARFQIKNDSYRVNYIDKISKNPEKKVDTDKISASRKTIK